MDFSKLVKMRKTTFEFSEKDVSDAHIMKMIEAARWAPSCTNSQPWHFIVIKNKKTIDALMDHVNYGFFHGDPRVIVAAILLQKRCAGSGHACFRGKDSAMHDTFASVGIAVEHMALQATELGIGSCILTPEQNVKKILGVKKEDVVPLVIGLGYEKKGAFKRKRERLDLKDLVSYERFKG